MKEKIFKNLDETKKKTKKWLFFPISLLIHGLVIIGFVIVPLLEAENSFPNVRILVKLLKVPQQPSPPRAPKKGSKPENDSRETNTDSKPKPENSGRIVTPIEIPVEIEPDDEDLFPDLKNGNGGGVIGGIGEEDADYETTTAEIFGSQQSIENVVHRINKVYKRPKLVRKITPIYPLIAKKAHIEGSVIIDAKTDIYGKVVSTTFIKGPPLLRRAAEDAVKKWIYEPYIFCGVPRPVIFSVIIHFSLSSTR